MMREKISSLFVLTNDWPMKPGNQTRTNAIECVASRQIFPVFPERVCRS
jgi:hypothetical protein